MVGERRRGGGGAGLAPGRRRGHLSLAAAARHRRAPGLRPAVGPASAEELQEAKREADEQGGGVQMRLPFEPSLDDHDHQFYVRPQPAPPPKDVVEPPPEFYQPPGRDA